MYCRSIPHVALSSSTVHRMLQSFIISAPHITFEPSGSLYKLTHLQSSIHRPLIQWSHLSLPDMLLVHDCGYSASFTQCLPDILGILSLLPPVSINDISLFYQHHCDPTVPLPSAPSFFNAPNPSFTYFYAAVTNLHSLDPSIDLQSLLFIHRHESKLQHFLYERCYQSSLS